jgi:poly-gamma-glutamate synthesis protein (capsule biosynthesis protein)
VPEIPSFSFTSIREEDVSGTMLFVGDIMLARRVEALMNSNGSGYPFAYLRDRIAYADVAVGNFEGSVPEVHVPTPELTYRFSVRSEHFSALKDVGFDVLSLANNHALDFGTEGLSNTQALCIREEIICGGDPLNRTSTTTVIMVGDTRVGILFLHTLYAFPSREALSTTLDSLTTESEVQIAYIHWGDEYKKTPNESERRLAHALIDAGADTIVGHHPHVIQTIEHYRGSPIIYSLGNFVFDQYFSDDVKTGLMVEFTIQRGKIEYALIPIASIEEQSRPALLLGSARDAVLEALLPQMDSVHQTLEYLHPVP